MYIEYSIIDISFRYMKIRLIDIGKKELALYTFKSIVYTTIPAHRYTYSYLFSSRELCYVWFGGIVTEKCHDKQLKR